MALFAQIWLKKGHHSSSPGQNTAMTSKRFHFVLALKLVHGTNVSDNSSLNQG
jgi:hypothetical protein